jgi:iron complex outermembrane receptor protein
VRHCGDWPAPGAFDTDALWNYEAGTKLRLADSRLRVGASAFYIRWTGMQDHIADPCGNTYTLNAGDAVSTGVDFDATLDLGHWQLSAAVERLRTYHTNTVRDGLGQVVALRGTVIGNPYSAAPPWSTRIAIRRSWPAAAGTFDLRVEGRLHSRNDGPYTAADPAAVDHALALLGTEPATRWWQLQAGWARGAWRASLAIENLGNEHPVLQVNTDGPGSLPLYANTVRPRTVRLELQRAFRAAP